MPLGAAVAAGIRPRAAQVLRCVVFINGLQAEILRKSSRLQADLELPAGTGNLLQLEAKGWCAGFAAVYKAGA